MLAGLLSPTSGQITIKGLNLSENLLKVKQYVGLVPQEIALYPTISARDNLIFWGQVYGLHGAALKSRVDEVLDIVQLADRAHERI
jgi:ABC-2 type transport system ATP-binding protein